MRFRVSGGVLHVGVVKIEHDPVHRQATTA